jgi:hypothetical protein
MPAEGLCNRSDRKNHTKQQKTPHHHSQTQLTQRVTERTHVGQLRSRIAAGVRHKPSRHIKVPPDACLQKGCVTILSMTHRVEASPLASQRNHTVTSTETATTDTVSLRSRIAAGLRHKPSSHIEVTVRTCQQKGCAIKLIAARYTHRAEASPLTSQRNGIITSTEIALTDIISFRSRIAAGVRHKPPRDIKVTMVACAQKGCAIQLITAPHTHTEQHRR